MEHRKLKPYIPEDHPGEELVEMDPSVVLPEGVTLMPGVKVYIRSPEPTAAFPDPDKVRRDREADGQCWNCGNPYVSTEDGCDACDA